MKRIFMLSAMVLATAGIASAQNVGIGTTTPAARLDVKTTGQYVAQFNGTSPMYMGIFENDVYRGYWGSFSGNDADVDFGTGSGTTGKLHLTIQANPRLTIGADGNVGIGTTNPQYKLHVEGGDGFFNTGTGFFRFGFTGSNQWRIGSGAGGADLVWSTAPDASTFTTRHYFAQNGNVGIGVGFIAPLGRLDVQGTGSSSSTNTFLLRNSLGDTLLRMRDDGRMGIGYNGSSYGRTLNMGGTGINFYTANEVAFGGAIFPTDTSLVIWSNSGSNNYLVLQPSWGNTGIGTYTPNAKFHLNGAMLVGGNSARTAVGYSLSVDGRIMAEEVTVQNSTSWPDYVFANDYKLMPLNELEASINKNKHLPNIPAAAEVEKNGITLGEMNRKLMEKVEELTLYIIELNKKNEALAQKVQVLENKATDRQ
jgi:hypothetical protein